MGGGTPDMFAERQGEAGRAPGAKRAARASLARWRSPTTRSATKRRPSANAYLSDYYAFLGDMADQIAGGAAKDAQTAKGYVEAFEAVGCDELIMFPSSSDPDQVDLLAEAVL